ncbi:MAG: HIT domain-containing protein [Salinivenus sp.]
MSTLTPQTSINLFCVMDRMWSPWRSEYVSEAAGRTPTDGASIFTTLLNENEDAENLILWRGEEVFVIMNLYPYNNGHLLIVPYREVEAYTALTVAEQRAVAATIDRCIEWLHTALAPEGVNVGMNLGRAAGAGIPEHLHVHVVPRWDGDTNFMSTTAETRVLPEDLSTTYDRLRAAVEDSLPTDDS